MRPVSSPAFKWISVLCVVLAFFAFATLASAQAAAGSKRKLSQQSLYQAPAVGSLALVHAAKPNAAVPLVTTDTWTGGGGADTGWSDAANWNNGAITSGENIVINLTTAATVVDGTFTIGTLMLGGTGDSATIANGQDLIVDGNISNAGTITLGSTTTYTYLQVGAANITLSGTGTLVLGSATPYNIVQATASGNTLTNQSTITGAGTIGNGTGLVLSNSGTINANVSGQTLLLNPGASTNTGTLEATNGGTLVLSGASWTQTSPGTITAATGSAVVLKNGVTVTGGTLTTSGTGFVYGDGANLVGVTNTGQFEVQNNNVTNISGTINNTGTITLDSTTTWTYLQLNGNATLTGSGTLVLGSANIYNVIQTATSGLTLTNQSTIQGEGTIGNGTGLIVSNSGTINANVSGQNLVLNSASASTNTGTLEATGGGTLVLSGQYGGNWTNTSGNITAATGSAVVLNNGVTVTGGTLTGSGTGIVYGDGATLVGLTIAGNFQVQNNNITNIQGTINNTGTITLASTTTYTELNVAPSGATLSGGGTVVMGRGAQYAYIQAQSGTPTFTNSNNTIEGTGQIGNGNLALVNNGTINANVSPTVLNTPLELHSDSGGITNTNVLEATNGGQLEIYSSTVTNTGSGAKIEAIGADGSGNASNVYLNAATINGGTLTTSGAGVIYGDNNTTLVGVTNAGNFNVQNNNITYLSGTITNTGTITLNSTTTYTQLDTNGSNVTLTGGGTVVMGAGAPYAYIQASGSGTTFTNLNNTIEGDGVIGNGNLTFVNNGTVNANVSGQTLNLDPVAGTNTATMEATGGGQLELQGSSWTNTGGTITAAASSDVYLNGTTITGGTLTTSGTGATAGVIYGDGSTTLVGVTNAGNFNVQNNNITYLSGTITNTGTITLNSTTTYTQLDTNGSNVTLTGGGTVVMGAGAPYAYIQASGSGTTFTNLNNTIEGDGVIGNGNLTFVNHGIVNANVSGQTLEIQPASTDTNTKTMEATNGAQLELYAGKWTNTGGTITAAGTGSDVLLDGTTVTGGTLTTSGTGIVYGENNSTLVGLTNAGKFQVLNNNTNYLSGTINNTGTITIGSTTTYTYLDLAANTTLTGSGKVVMGAGAQYSIIDGATGLTFTNSGNTIEGDGVLGNGHLVVTNKTGSIIANVSGQNLTINSSGVGTTNDGTFEGTNGGNLVVQGTLTNYSSGTNTLTGGTYIANGGNVTLPLGGSGGISTLSATIVEENGGQILNSNNGNANALNGLTSITSTGSLTIGGAPAFVDAGAFSNAGSLTILGGQNFTVGSLTQISGNTLTGGTYVLDANLNLSGATQSITTNAANLTLAGGTIENANSTNALAALATNTGSLTLANGANFTTAGNFSNTGTLTEISGSTFTVTGSLSQYNSATNTLQGGTFVVGGTLAMAAGANGILTDSSNLTLEGTGTIKNTTCGANVNALINLNTIGSGGSLTLASNAKFTAAGNFTNSGALTIDKGSTFTLTGSNVLTNLSGGTLSGGTYTIGGTLQLTSTNGGITTNAANLTLTGTTAKIMDGASNALAGFDNNTGTFALSTGAKLTTAASNFTNSGTVMVASGTTLTVGGTGNSYNQSAGTTTVDGTLVGGGTTGVSVTGGTIQGAGTLKTNVSLGGGMLNVGDAGKAGLLKITGTYTQLASGTMNVSVGGITVGTKYSQLQITGTASLAGTLAVGLINSFTPTIGQTFTVLKAGSITGTFSNSTIGINGTEHFVVSYTATTVVLTVATGAASSTATGALQAVIANTKPASVVAKPPVAISGLRHRIGVPVKLGKPIFVSGLYREGGHSNPMIGQAWEGENLRVPHGLPVVSLWHPTSERPTPVAGIAGDRAMRPTPVSNPWVGGNDVRVSSAPGLIGLSTTRRPAPPVRMLPTHIPIMATVR